jgi:hypothetical protein
MVLLLLVVVAQLTLSLSRHPSLRLRHLVRIVGSGRIALVLIEALNVRGRVGARAIVLADRVVTLGAAHALLLLVVGVGTRSTTAAHHGHGLAAVTRHGCRREPRAKGLPALGEVFLGTFDFLELGSKGIGLITTDS